MPPLILLIQLLVLALTGCVLDEREAGNAGTSQQGNAISGIIRLDDGTPASHAAIKLIPPGYSPAEGETLPDSLVTTTNQNGEFSLSNVTPGSYGLEITASGNIQVLFKRGIEVVHDSTINISEELAKPGTVIIQLPEYITQSGGFIIVPESSIYKKISEEAFAAGEVELPQIPQGVLPSITYMPEQSPESVQVVANEVVIHQERVTTISPYYYWPHHQTIEFKDGIDTDETDITLNNYPLLVRLNKNNFPFQKAAKDGSDIRFSNPDGAKLNYDIEYWDADKQQADIWVQLKSVALNLEVKHIFIHYGNLNAQSHSSGPSVWTSATGYEAVWHLNDFYTGPDTIHPISDSMSSWTNGSTKNKNIAFLQGEQAYESYNGITGPNSFHQGPDLLWLNFNKYISLSGGATQEFWVNLKSLPDSGRQKIVHWGDLRGYVIKINHVGQLILYLRDGRREYEQKLTTSATLTAGEWLHFGYTSKNYEHSFYINGEFIPFTDFERGQYFVFGQDQEGIYDEFRFADKAFSPFWLKLNALTQAPTSNAVTVLPAEKDENPD